MNNSKYFNGFLYTLYKLNLIGEGLPVIQCQEFLEKWVNNGYSTI